METQASRQQQIAMLKILYGACSAALDAFHAADNPIDGELVVDLEKMVERTRVELERVAAAEERWPLGAPSPRTRPSMFMSRNSGKTGLTTRAAF
jgi:hypothetical protein